MVQAYAVSDGMNRCDLQREVVVGGAKGVMGVRRMIVDETRLEKNHLRTCHGERLLVIYNHTALPPVAYRCLSMKGGRGSFWYGWGSGKGLSRTEGLVESVEGRVMRRCLRTLCLLRSDTEKHMNRFHDQARSREGCVCRFWRGLANGSRVGDSCLGCPPDALEKGREMVMRGGVYNQGA